LKEIETIDPSDRAYSDEFGMDDNDEVAPVGWSLKGERCYAQKKAFRKARYNTIAALNLGLLFAPFLFEGYLNTAIYETYIERILAPALRPGMVFIIDNARFHKSQKIIDLIEAVGCRVLFLPPYSPDLNPIEHQWTAVKQAIRRATDHIKDFYEAATHALGEMCKAK